MKRAALLLALLWPLAARADFADHFARGSDVPYDKIPSRGHSKVLVLPIEVAGHPAFDMDALRTFFGSGPDSFGNYYNVVSHGLYSVEATVVDPVQYAQCPLNTTEFPDCAVTRGDPGALTPALGVLRDALTQVHSRGVKFTDFDVNGPAGTVDGTIDGFLLLTNTPFGGIALPVFEFNDGDNLSGGTGGPFILDGVKIPYVAIAGEHEVLLHEFGHLLGFTDLYDEDDYKGGLNLSLMGNWEYDANPPLLDAESRYRIGWAPTVDVDRNAVLRVEPAERGSAIYKVGVDPEYFLIENRGPGDFTDRDLKDRGIAIYHVDRSKGPTGDQGGFVSRLLHCVNCDLYHPYILNEPARGAYRWLDFDHFDEQDLLWEPGQQLGPDPASQPFSAAHPAISTALYDGGSSGVTIRVVEREGDSFLVDVQVPPGTPPCAQPHACPAGYVCPDERCYEPSPAKGGCASGSGAGWLGLLAACALAARRRLTSS